tara:strand:+ start:549 stop:1352 length:804 start_codon:yes stop_codon:yes gene_type:complete
MPTNYTLSYSDKAEGWPSFYSFFPDYMIGMNSYFYTFKNGNLYRHNTSPNRNEYYGVPGDQAPSTITSVLSPRPVVDIKLFKTLTYESNQAWECTALNTDLTDGSPGSMLETYFVQKEGEWFTYIRNNDGTINYRDRSTTGIGVNTNVNAAAPAAVIVTFSSAFSQTISIGDTLFASNLTGSTSDAPVQAGTIVSISNIDPTFTITIDTTAVTSTVPVTGQFMTNIKNSVAESHGARGYYLEFTLSNNDITPVELFSVGSSVMKSYP